MMIIRYINYILKYIYNHIIMPRFLTRRYRNLLKKNLVLKGSCRGKRCFIIGGGPSVKTLDTMHLANEQTFVVNEFDSHAQYYDLKPKHHLMIDTAYFTQGDEHYLTQLFLKKTSTVPKDTTIFLNALAHDFVVARNLFPHHAVYYLSMHGIMSDKFSFSLALDKTVPWPKNSILMSLIVAVYMGFERIYLLGCEHSFLAKPIGRGKSLTYDHSYHDERTTIDLTDAKVVQAHAGPRDLNLTYEANIARIKQLFKNYRLFWDKVQKEHPRVQIYNATPESFLDVFPMIDFNDIKF